MSRFFMVHCVEHVLFCYRLRYETRAVIGVRITLLQCNYATNEMVIRVYC